ncbi:hypothetical protein BX666DRAFT_1855045 [Dichotomocladium elegans]|nr:hypothetical protein BX666DRAFT_1855045 [Dichotomocladium elegans]
MARCFSGKGRQFGVYLSGMLFAVAWWLFIDAVTFSCKLSDRTVYIGFEDWAPGIITTLGMITICLIDKEALRGSYGDGPSPVARLFLFLGFTMLAGGFAGSVSVLVVKYEAEDLGLAQTYAGYGIVAQCTLIMISTAILWVSQSTEESVLYI